MHDQPIIRVFIQQQCTVALNDLCCSGVETKFKGAFYEVLLSVSHVPELSRVQEEEGGLLVGAAVSLNTLKQKLTDMMGKLPG